MSSTANFEKIIKGADAVLDCIPIVSTVSNATQAIYKLAHRVDALSPVVPGLKTSIKIHVLSKNNFDCFFASIPLAGNLIALVKLVTYVLCGFNNDLKSAIRQNNEEVVDLCLKNNSLNDAPDAAKDIFSLSVSLSNNRIFKQILKSRSWDIKDLMTGLKSCSECINDDNVANANDILDIWINNQTVLQVENECHVIWALKGFLENDQTAVVGRILDILPESISFDSINDILLKYSCAQSGENRSKKTGVLTQEQRNKLIAKSKKPSLRHLKEYYHPVAKQLEEGISAANVYHEVHFGTLNKLLNKAELEPNAMCEFIISALEYDEFIFIKPLVKEYASQYTFEQKSSILGGVLPHYRRRLGCCDEIRVKPFNFVERIDLFNFWIQEWKADFSTREKLFFLRAYIVTSIEDNQRADASLSSCIDKNVLQDENEKFNDILRHFGGLPS